MSDKVYDAVIVGAGIAGSIFAEQFARAGMACVVLEAGCSFDRDTYPANELDANSQLYWGGGIELSRDASIGLLRPKVVGGGSIVNGALLDRFDEDAFDSWRSVSGVEFLDATAMVPWYERVGGQLAVETVDERYRNGNAEVFRRGFEANGYRFARLERAQSDCRYGDGNCCIVCLAGCPIDSKQSTPVTTLGRALGAGLELVSEFEATQVVEGDDAVVVHGTGVDGRSASYCGRRLVLAAGAIGNSKLLLLSGFAKRLPALGRNFFTHPQYMNLAVYDEPVDAFLGPLQNYKSAEPSFRRGGFKLENVFAPPVSIAMLVPGFGVEHQRRMSGIRHVACAEVAVRDTNPGRIRVGRRGRLRIDKTLGDEDRRRRDRGRDAIRNIFYATGAREIIEGDLAIGLHLMGGCAIGVDAASSVVSPEFRIHGSRRIYAADSSIFPNAPGINPSMTIMALATMAAERVAAEPVP